jgi:hypothetical protein
MLTTLEMHFLGFSINELNDWIEKYGRYCDSVEVIDKQMAWTEYGYDTFFLCVNLERRMPKNFNIPQLVYVACRDRLTTKRRPNNRERVFVSLTIPYIPENINGYKHPTEYLLGGVEFDKRILSTVKGVGKVIEYSAMLWGSKSARLLLGLFEEKTYDDVIYTYNPEDTTDI